ncbi:MAG: tetratricopeptide repeat protein [Akkermansiaceae bacterium]
MFPLKHPVIMASPDSPHNQLQELIRSKQWNSALVIAYEMLETQPESSWLHTTLGKIYYHLQEYKHAETSLKTAIYHHQHYADAHTLLGQVYLKMNRIGSADDHCKQALALDSSDIQALSLHFQIKLAYSDLPAAKECYATIQRLSSDQELLHKLQFDLIRHHANKEPVDHKSEISSRQELLITHPHNSATHAQLAYLYNHFTQESDLAQTHIQTALQHNPTDPQIQETSTLIHRKKNLWLRILTAPTLSLTRPHQISKNEVATVGLVVLALITIAIIGNHTPWIIRTAVFTIITIFFCSYTANLAYQYLHRTEIIHRHGKTSHFKAPYLNIHLLPFPKRRLIIVTLTILSWAALALSLFLITR